MDIGPLDALHTPEGAALLAAAADLVGDDPLAAVTALRRRGAPPEHAAAALTQARLRARAAGKFGSDAARMFFTPDGLQQATRREVASRRAARLAGAGVRRLVDLGCGVGADSIAAARAGIRVDAVEADPATAAVAAANVAALGLAATVQVTRAPAEETDLTGADAVFCDPSRRHGGSGRRTFDPADFSPPWSFVARLPERVPRTVLKLAPGWDHALIPAGAEAEWVSVGGDLVEAALWCGPLAEVPRRASLLPAQAGSPDPGGAGSGEPAWETTGAATLTGTGKRDAPVGPVRRYLLDPDPAVVRAHLVAELADRVHGTLADATIAYLYVDEPTTTRYARCLEIRQALPFSRKRLRAALRDAGVGRVEIMKRGSAVDVEWLRRELRLSGDRPATVVLTRVAGAPTALICDPAPMRRPAG